MVLVVLRSGHSDLRNLFELDAAPQFDIALSCFKQTDGVDFPNVKYHHFCVGGKWEGLYDFFYE